MMPADDDDDGGGGGSSGGRSATPPDLLTSQGGGPVATVAPDTANGHRPPRSARELVSTIPASRSPTGEETEVVRRQRFAARLDRLPSHFRRGTRRIVVLLALMPLLVLLALGTPRLPAVLRDPLLVYGTLVLGATVMMMYLGYARYEDPSIHPRPPGRRTADFPVLPAQPRVSLMVAVHDEVNGIENCVRSMIESDYPDLEVIVVDDASTDGTQDVLRRLADELGVEVVYCETNRGKKYALTEAVARSNGDVLAFTDSDCVLAENAVSRCVRALVLDPGLGAVSGHARALNADETVLTRAVDTWIEGQFRVAKAAEATFGCVTCVSGPLAVFRRDAIVNYLPAWIHDTFLGKEFRFATDRQLTAYVLGQQWVGRRMKKAHADASFVRDRDYPERRWRVGYVRSAHVWTIVPRSMRPFLRQQIRWKKSFVRNLFFNGRFMWRWGIGPGAIYYGHALWSMVAPVMAFRHFVWAPVQGLYILPALYLCGLTLKGFAWAIAFKIDNPSTTRWRYRPLMTLISALVLAWLLPYSILTIRRAVWKRSS